MSNLYRGTSLQQDGRFRNHDHHLISSHNWPALLTLKINTS